MTDTNGDFAFDDIVNATPDDDGLITIPMMLVHDDVILPHSIAPLPIDFDELHNSRAAYYAIDNQQTAIYVNHAHLLNDERNLLEQINRIGTEVALLNITDNDDQYTFLMAQGRRRVEVVEIIEDEPFFKVKARVVDCRLHSRQRVNYVIHQNQS
ncbi:MAG: LON peptidase substrate-binding domain-containing protein, partial [Chloroflexota bacterium]